MPSSNTIYVPILKWKRGEFNALQDTNDIHKQIMAPILEIMPPDYNFRENIFKNNFKYKMDEASDRIVKSWRKDLPFFIDLKFIDNPPKLPGGRKWIKYKSNPLGRLYNQLSSKGFFPVPTVSFHSSPPFYKTASRINQSYNCGICLRIDMNILSKKNAKEKIKTFVDTLVVSQKHVDLVIDLGDFQGIQPEFISQVVAIAIKNIPSPANWRKLILAGSSVPVDLSGVDIGEQFLPRTEWTVWSDLVRNKRFSRIPIFSDYGISHPELKILDARNINISASIRYTIDDQYVIFRGRGVRSRGSGGNGQYRSHCKELVKRRYYSGKNFSEGDLFIYQTARGEKGPGNAETWRRQGTNHHINFVADQLSSFAGF
jgi:hypothetical protein